MNPRDRNLQSQATYILEPNSVFMESQSINRDYCHPCYVTCTAQFLASCISCELQPPASRSCHQKRSVFLTTSHLISLIHYTSDLLLQKDNRTDVISEFWKTPNHRFGEGPVSGSARRGWATAGQRAEGKRWSNEAPCSGQASTPGCRQAGRVVALASPSCSTFLDRRRGKGYQSDLALGCAL